MSTIADVPLRAALDPTLSATALRLLVYFGAVVQNGGFAECSIRHLAQTLTCRDDERTPEEWVRELRIALHQLMRGKYLQRSRRAVLDECNRLVRKQYVYRVRLAG